MKIILYLARKYVKLDSHTVLPVISISIGIAFLMVVVSIIDGFDAQLIENLTSVGPDILLQGEFNENSLKLLKDYNAYLYNREEGIIFNPKYSTYSGVQINILPKSYIDKYYGSSYTFMIGDALSKKLKLSTLDSVYLYVPNGNIENISPDIYQIGKIFKTGIYQYDLLNVVIEKDLQYAPFVFIKLNNPMNAEKDKNKIKRLFPFAQVFTWMDMNENIIKSLNLESIVVFLIIAFTLLLSGFGISNSLFQRVYEKRRDMGILFSMGFSKKDIANLIIFEGILIWFIGSLFGFFGGILLEFVINNMNIHLPSNIYYVTKVPVIFSLSKSLMIILFSFVVTLLASLFPAMKAFKEDPIDLIRFE